MYFNLKKKKTSTRFLSALLFLSVFVTSIVVQIMPVKADRLFDYKVKNKRYFIKVGDKVYFRKFGKKALPASRTWTRYYLEDPTGEKGSFVAVYNTKTNKVEKAFDDDGSFLCYMNKRFYMEHKGTVYSVDKKGGKYKKLSDKGEIVGAFSNKYIVIEKNNGSIVYNNNRKVCELKNKYIGIIEGNYAICMEDIDYSYTRVWCKGLKSPNKLILLGKIDRYPPGLTQSYFHQVMRKKSNIYFSIKTYGGTAEELNGCCLYKINPKKENSLEMISDNLVENYSSIKDFDIDKKGRVKLFSKKNIDEKVAIKALIKKIQHKENNKDIQFRISDSEYIDGNCFMIIEKEIWNPIHNAGWKAEYTYDVLERYYVRIPVKNPNKLQILYKDVFK